MSNATGRLERKLAAIFAADVAGYSRLMSADEVGTLRTLTAHREIMDRLIAEHGGRVANTAGDSVLAEFPSAVDAVECAVAVQERLAESNSGVAEDRRLQFRIGVHVGDVAVRGGDLLGDGVNIAARLESLAEPGGICISGAAHEYVRKTVPVTFADLGEQNVKNLAEPIRAYSLRPPQATSEKTTTPLPFPDKPSIAVLPFTNMSGDPEQEYFADGVVEDIITALSRFEALFVIARNSSFTYKGRAVDIKQVGRELGVRYVLEGSVRKAGSRVRIGAQLIDTSTGVHLWANRFDGALEDVFDLQDQVTTEVVCAIVPAVEQAEIDRVRRKPTANLGSYDLYLRAVACLYDASSADKIEEALSLLRDAIRRDPAFAAAYGRAASCFNHLLSNFRTVLSSNERAEAVMLARKAVQLGQLDAIALSTGGLVLTYIGHDYDAGSVAVERAVLLNPNLLIAVRYRAWVRLMSGNPAGALADFSQAARLNPLDPSKVSAWYGCAFSAFLLDEFDDGYGWAEKALKLRPSYTHALAALAINAVRLGRTEEAQGSIRALRAALPELRIAHVADLFLMRLPVHRDKIVSALLSAGLPE